MILLLLILILQFHATNDFEQSELLDLITDTQECCKRIFKNKKKQEEEEQPINVLTDVLLGLLTKPNQLVQNVPMAVLKAFSDNITLTVLDTLMDVLTEDDQQENDEENDDHNNDHNDSGEEEENNEDEEDESDEDSEHHDHSSHTKSTKMEVDDIDDETINVDDEDEETLAKYDEMLSKIFKQRKGSKENDMIDFKIRVLELLKVVVKKLSDNENIFSYITSLLQLVQKKYSKII